MRISEIKKQALETLRGNWGLTVLLTFLMVLVISLVPLFVAIPMSGGFTQWTNQNDDPISVQIFQFIYSIVLIPFSISVYWFYLNLVREEKPEISQVFLIYQQGRTSLKLVGASIVYGIFILLWTILLIIPGIIKSFSYSQTFFILKDHPEYTITQAISESRIRMKGYKWKYFLLNLSFIGWVIISFGIGLLWLYPYINTSNAVFYNELIATQDSKDKDILI